MDGLGTVRDRFLTLDALRALSSEKIVTEQLELVQCCMKGWERKTRRLEERLNIKVKTRVNGSMPFFSSGDGTGLH